MSAPTSKLAPHRPHAPGWAAAIHPTLEYTTLPLTITATTMPVGHGTRFICGCGPSWVGAELMIGKRPMGRHPTGRSGRRSRAVAETRIASVRIMVNPVHHIELWTDDLSDVVDSFHWLFTELGWRDEPNSDWPQGRIWRHESGVYLVLEESPDVRTVRHDRTRPGLNHLALRGPDLAHLDHVRAECIDHGWTELFAERYPHAGGAAHTALFLENSQGFEIEIVA